MSGSRSVTVEMVQAGQPRAYADSIYEGFLTFTTPEGQLWASKFGHKDDQTDMVKQYVRLFIHGFSDEPAWHEPRLKTLRMVSPGRWHAVVVQPYLD